MKLEQAKELKPNQIIYYKSIFICPIDVEVEQTKYDYNSQLEIHFTDNTFVKEKDFNQLFIKKEDCINSCIEELNEKLKKLKEELNESI